MATGDLDGTIVLWDVASGRKLSQFQTTALTVETLAFSPDNRTLAAALKAITGGEFRLWNLTNSRQLATLKAERQGQNALTVALAFSPDGKTLATACDRYPITLWDVANRNERTSLGGHEGAITCLAFSPDGQMLTSAGADPDGPIDSSGGKVVIWNIRTGKEHACLRIPENRGGVVFSLAFSPDGALIATGGLSRGAVSVWDKSSKERTALRGHSDVVSSVAFCPDGKAIVSASWDGTVKLRDVATGKDVLTLTIDEELGRLDIDRKIRCVAVSPDGRILAATLGNTVRLVNLPHRGRGKD